MSQKYFFKLLDGEQFWYKQKYTQWTERLPTPLTNIDDPYSVNRENEMQVKKNATFITYRSDI